MELETFAGNHISEVCKRAVALATSEDVTFEFNGIEVVARPGESAEQIEARWHTDLAAASERRQNSQEYKDAEAKREEEWRQKLAAHLTEPAQTEADMREAKDPWPCTIEQLVEYVQSVTKRQHDYGTCVYAMSLAATAAFNFVAHQLGVTGFQSSCADLDFLRRSRGIKGPFMLVKGEDFLYPQCDPRGKLAEALADWNPWLCEQAAKKLAETPGAHPDVVAHWKRLAEAPDARRKAPRRATAATYRGPAMLDLRAPEAWSD
jgi:hypothetical protein